MRKLVLLPIHLFLLSGFLFAQHTEYYSTVRFVETPLSKIEGSVPLSASEALNRHHYRFSFSVKNKLTSIEFFNGEKRKRPNHTANLFTLSHRMVFNNTRNTEEVTFFDVHGNQVSVLGQVFKFVYELDENNLRTGLYFEDEQGERVENSWGIYNYEWEYDKNGYVLEARFNREGELTRIRPGFEFYRLRLFFDPNGHIRLMQNIDESGELVENSSGAAQDLITLNAQGNFVKWEVLDMHGNPEKGNGPNVAVGIQTFNKYGYEAGLENRDENNDLIYSDYGILESRTSFDEYGNLIERTFIGADGNPAPHLHAGYTTFKMYYDETGNFRERIEYFDEYNNPIHHQERGYWTAKYRYNTFGQLVKIEYLDTENKMVNRLDNGVAVIEYSYDQDGQIEKTIRRDKNLVIIE